MSKMTPSYVAPSEATGAVLPPLPDDVRDDLRRSFVVTVAEPFAAVQQMEMMGIPTSRAQLIYALNWYDDKDPDKPKTVNRSPFAVTDPRLNFGYPISFVTDQQLAWCLRGQNIKGDGLLLGVRSHVAGHEIGHHKTLLVMPQLVKLGGFTEADVAFVTDDTIDEDTVSTTASRLFESYCDMFGGLRVMRDRSTLTAFRTLAWLRDYRILNLWGDIEEAANTRTECLPSTAVKYASIHQAARHMLEHDHHLTRRVKGVNDDDLAVIALQETAKVFPAIEGEAQLLESGARRWMQKPRDRERMRQQIITWRKTEPMTLLGATVSPPRVLGRAMGTDDSPNPL